MKQEIEHSLFQQNIQRGVAAGIIKFNDDRTRITYEATRPFSAERFTNILR